MSERDAIRLLHKFGAEEQANSLAVSRSALLAQLGAIRGGITYAAFWRKREGVAKQLAAARAQTGSRRYPKPSAGNEPPQTVRLVSRSCTMTGRT